MESNSKVAYGLAVSSLLIAVLAGKAAMDRVAAGRTLTASEGAVLALATLDAKCKSGATVDWIEDEFAENMQDRGVWCKGTVPEVLSNWDSGLSYRFKGSVSAGPGLSFRWTRSPDLTEAQKVVKAALKKVDATASGDDRPVSYEILSFEQAPPLLVAHDVWVASAHVVPLNFGERLRLHEWVAYSEPNQEQARTVAELREHIVSLGVQASASGKDPESVYRSLLANWENQTIKVPVLGVDLRYAYAAAALAFMATLQMLWLANSLTKAKVEEDAGLASRFSLHRQLADAAQVRSAKIIAFLDWVSVNVCTALALGAPTLCFLSVLLVYLATGAERSTTYIAGGFSIASLFVSAYIVTRIRKLVLSLPSPSRDAA